jgi:hypothetical protein
LSFNQVKPLGWVAQCADDLVGPNHPVRSIAEVVDKLDLSGLYEPIKAREGVSGRDSTDWWVYGYTAAPAASDLRGSYRAVVKRVPRFWGYIVVR